MGAAAMVFAMASLGLPGLGNFIGEFLVLLGAFKVNVALTAVATAGLVAATIYSLWLIQRVFFGPSAEPPAMEDLRPHESLVLLAMVAVLLWLGLFPQAVLETSRAAMEYVAGTQVTATAEIPQLSTPGARIKGATPKFMEWTPTLSESTGEILQLRMLGVRIEGATPKFMESIPTKSESTGEILQLGVPRARIEGATPKFMESTPTKSESTEEIPQLSALKAGIEGAPRESRELTPRSEEGSRFRLQLTSGTRLMSFDGCLPVPLSAPWRGRFDHVSRPEFPDVPVARTAGVRPVCGLARPEFPDVPVVCELARPEFPDVMALAVPKGGRR
jgi:hypothetical protein